MKKLIILVLLIWSITAIPFRSIADRFLEKKCEQSEVAIKELKNKKLKVKKCVTPQKYATMKSELKAEFQRNKDDPETEEIESYDFGINYKDQVADVVNTETEFHGRVSLSGDVTKEDIRQYYLNLILN